MFNKYLFQSILSVLLFCISIASIAQTFVVDNGNFFTASEISQLQDSIQAIREKTTVEILVYTIPDLNGKTPKEYGMDLANQHHMGKKGVNNGLLILFSSNDHKLQILNGYGMEWILSDETSKEIVRILVASFRNQNYFVGVSNALMYIEEKVAKVSWNVQDKNPTELTVADEGKIIRFEYSNKTGKTKYNHALYSDPQFSDGFSIPLGSDFGNYDLFYTKYMNELVANIRTGSSVVIYARFTDSKKKRLELLGIEQL